MKADKKKEATVDKDVKITYVEALTRYSVIKSILLSCNGKELSDPLKSQVMNGRFSLKRHQKTFDEMMKDAGDGFKPEGFDDRLKLSEEFERKIRQKYPESSIFTHEMLTENLTKEESAQSDVHQSFMVEYNKWRKDYENFSSEKLREEIKYDPIKFTREEFEEILKVNSSGKFSIESAGESKGKMLLVPIDLQAGDFLELFYDLFVD